MAKGSTAEMRHKSQPYKVQQPHHVTQSRPPFLLAWIGRRPSALKACFRMLGDFLQVFLYGVAQPWLEEV